jgi:hypothetical protein
MWIVAPCEASNEQGVSAAVPLHRGFWSRQFGAEQALRSLEVVHRLGSLRCGVLAVVLLSCRPWHIGVI